MEKKALMWAVSKVRGDADIAWYFSLKNIVANIRISGHKKQTVEHHAYCKQKANKKVSWIQNKKWTQRVQ